jgi:hypothetical protein
MAVPIAGARTVISQARPFTSWMLMVFGVPVTGGGALGGGLDAEAVDAD